MRPDWPLSAWLAAAVLGGAACSHPPSVGEPDARADRRRDASGTPPATGSVSPRSATSAGAVGSASASAA